MVNRAVEDGDFHGWAYEDYESQDDEEDTVTEEQTPVVEEETKPEDSKEDTTPDLSLVEDSESREMTADEVKEKAEKEVEKTPEELRGENKVLRSQVIALNTFTEELQTRFKAKSEKFFTDAREIMGLKSDGVSLLLHMRSSVDERKAIDSKMVVLEQRVAALENDVGLVRKVMSENALLRAYIANIGAGEITATADGAKAFLLEVSSNKGKEGGGTQPTGQS